MNTNTLPVPDRCLLTERPVSARTPDRRMVAIVIMVIAFLLIIGTNGLFAARLLGSVSDSLSLQSSFRHDGMTGVLSEEGGASLADDGVVTLTHGQLTMRAEPVGRVHVHGIDALFFFGSATFIAQDGSTDIAALDTPVLLTDTKSSHVVIVPPGMHVRVTDDATSLPPAQRIPAQWSASVLKKLPAQEPAQPASDEAEPFASLPRDGFTKEDTERFFAAASPFSDSSSMKEFLSLTLHAKRFAPDAEPLLLSQLRASSSHPLTLAVALASSLLQTDRPPADATIDFLGDLSLGAASVDVQGAVNDLLPLLEGLSLRTDDRFPLSKKRLMDLRSEFLSFLEPLLVSAGNSELRATVLAAQGRLSAAAPVMEPQEQDTTTLDRAYAIAITKQALLKHGFLLTVETKITFSEPRFTQVEGVFVSTARGDAQVSFRFDPVSGKAENIVLGGKRSPNALSLESLVSSLQ